MLSSISTKIALKKIGLPTNTFDFSALEKTFASDDPSRQPNKLRKDPPWLKPPPEETDSSWAGWLSAKALPLTVQPWLSPSPAAVPVGKTPQVGDKAPQDREGKLQLHGRKTVIAFLRCAGCACTFIGFLPSRKKKKKKKGKSCVVVNVS